MIDESIIDTFSNTSMRIDINIYIISKLGLFKC